MRSLPLDGVTVVACEQAVAAPLATRHLADLGARVIKVERPGGGDFARSYDATVRGMSSHFVWLNRSKQSVSLDLKHPAALAVMHRLIDGADVFVQNLAPGAAERLGLGSAALRARDPGLITCAITGYGDAGPYRDEKAYDLLIQSETGLVSVTGSPEHPAKAGIPTADIGAGMYAFAGIVSALYDRERTGQGSALEVSLFDSMVEWMGYPLYYTRYGGEAPRRTGTSHAAIAPYGTYTCGDGTPYVISVQNDREWRAFCDTVLELPGLAADVRFADTGSRVANRDQLDAVIEARLADVDGPTFLARLQTARIAHARQRDVEEVWEHPQLQARDRWRDVESPVGPLSAVLPPLTVDDREPRMDPIPAVGEHNRVVLTEIGYSDDDIDDLARQGLL